MITRFLLPTPVAYDVNAPPPKNKADRGDLAAKYLRNTPLTAAGPKSMLHLTI